MFKVPSDPANPTYTDAYTVTFWQWLTSTKRDRNEWRRRRDAATRTSTVSRYLAAKEAHAQGRLGAARQAKQNLRAEKLARRADKQARKAAARRAKQARKRR